MAKVRIGQADLFAALAPADGGVAEDVPRWVEEPEYSQEVRGRLERQLAELRATAVWPFHNITAAAQVAMGFHALAELWLPPRAGHALQLAFDLEMDRLGEAADCPTYDWKGRYRPVPEDEPEPHG